VTRAWFAALPLTLGCALDPGHGFATVEAASLEGRFEPGPARGLDGGFLTDEGYAVTLDLLTLDVESIGFDELRTAGGGEAFDPAHPPPGYTLCHGGHCHAEDGRLVPYAEVEAELSGGGGFARVVTLGAAAVFDLLDSAKRPLSDAVPSNELPRTSLRRIVVRARTVEVRGAVESEVLTPPRELDLTLAGAFEVASPFELAIGDEGLGAIELDVTLELDGTLFDGVDFADLPDEELQTSAVDGALGAALLTGLAGAEVSVRVKRR